MMKKFAGMILAGMAAMMMTTTAFAGQFVSGYHIAVVDDCAGSVKSFGQNDFPVEMDLDANTARVKVYHSAGSDTLVFNQRTSPTRYRADNGAELEYFGETDSFRMITYDGVDYITR